MHGMTRPSLQAMEQATRMGAAMAQNERVIRPDVTAAEAYVTYAIFAEAHRAMLEKLREFDRWERRLTSLIEQAAVNSGLSLSDRASCDTYVRHFAKPLRCSFWYGWETAVGLKALYDNAHDAARARDEIHVLRVADTARAGMPTKPPGWSSRRWKSDGDSGLLDLSDDLENLSVRPEDITSFLQRPGADA